MVHGRFIVYTLYPDKAQTMAYQMAVDRHVYAFSPRLRHPITWPLATASFITYKRAIFYYTLFQGKGKTGILREDDTLPTWCGAIKDKITCRRNFGGLRRKVKTEIIVSRWKTHK